MGKFSLKATRAASLSTPGIGRCDSMADLQDVTTLVSERNKLCEGLETLHNRLGPNPTLTSPDRGAPVGMATPVNLTLPKYAVDAVRESFACRIDEIGIILRDNYGIKDA